MRETPLSTFETRPANQGAAPPFAGDEQQLFAKFLQLQRYVNWSEADAARLACVRDLLIAALPALVDGFYLRVLDCDATRSVIVGGLSQVARLKQSLRSSLSELLTGPYDQAFVARRWQIGARHLQIGLDESFVVTAMSQLRTGMMRVIADLPEADQPARDAIDKLLDLDLAIIQDAYATQRLRLERDHERRMGEIRFRKLVEAATVAVLIFDKQGRIAYVSPFAEQLSGYSTDELMGQSFARLLIAGKQQSAINLEKVITGNNDCRDLDLIFVTRSGEQRRWLCNLNGIDDVNGQPAMLMVAHDTTEWHATQERLGRSERLAGIGQMVAGLAHESRNALQRIGSMAEMLELECASNETALALITRLSQAQDDLRRMFDELRNYAAPIHLELEDCHVASCWHEAWELVKPLRGGRQVEWIERIECGDATVLADRFRLVQVLRNLIENAMIACGDDAQIEVVAIESSAVPGGFELRIGDNGPGIANEHRERIFEPFFTTRTKGSGLGLAIARRVIDAHGGTIAAGKSRLGGAEIGITLPPGAERP